MAEPQPATPPAADPANPQVPGQQPVTPPADGNPATPPASPAITLSDEQKTYLKGQGIAEDKLSDPDSILKLITHAQTSQKSAAEIKSQLDKIKSTVVPPVEPTNPFALTPQQPAVSSQPQDGNPTPPQQPQGQPQSLDVVTAYTLSNQLATSFPTLKDDLTSGKLYQDMSALGIPLRTADGQVNLNGIINFSKMQHEQRELQAKIDAANKPVDGAIPDANPTTPTQPAADAPMTKQMAQAILVQDPNHARAAEAKQFLQGTVKK